jgi:hypothetical protein
VVGKHIAHGGPIDPQPKRHMADRVMSIKKNLAELVVDY